MLMFFVVVPSLNDVFIFWIGVGFLLWLYNRIFNRKSKAMNIISDIRITDKLRDCAYVNQFYIETRYPSDSYIPVSEKEAQDCMDAARKLMELLA